MGTVGIADGERPSVRTERKCPHRSYDRAEITELRGALETSAGLAQRPCVEEGHATVIAADGKSVTVAAERVVEYACAAAVQHRDRRRASQESGEEVTPRRDRVVEVDALPRQQEGAVEPRLDERLCAEPLRDRRGRLALGGASRRQGDRSRGERCDEQEHGDRK